METVSPSWGCNRGAWGAAGSHKPCLSFDHLPLTTRPLFSPTYIGSMGSFLFMVAERFWMLFAFFRSYFLVYGCGTILWMFSAFYAHIFLYMVAEGFWMLSAFCGRWCWCTRLLLVGHVDEDASPEGFVVCVFTVYRGPREKGSPSRLVFTAKFVLRWCARL